MTDRKDEVEVMCQTCGWLFWVKTDSPQLKDGRLSCPMCSDTRNSIRVGPLEDEDED